MCSKCQISPHDTNHLFNCPANPTSLPFTSHGSTLLKPLTSLDWRKSKNLIQDEATITTTKVEHEGWVADFWKFNTLKILSSGLNLSQDSNMVGSTSNCIQFSRFKPALNWNCFFGDLRHGLNSLNSDTGWLLSKTVGTTAAESTNAAANIFLGQTEAPLLIKPFLPVMTK